MRIVTVENRQHFISNEKAEKLLASDAVYVCGSDEFKDHDLHLNPEHTFSFSEVEMLMR